MRITTRLNLNTLLSIASMLIVGFALLTIFQTGKRHLSENRKIIHLTTAVFELDTLTNDYLLNHSEQAEKQWYLRYGSLLSLSKDISYKNIHASLLKERITNRFSKLETLFSFFTSISSNGKNTPEETIRSSELRQRIAGRLTTESLHLISLTEDLLDISNEKLLSISRNIFLALMAVIAVVMILVLLNSLGLRRSILEPLLALQRGTQIAGEGNLKYRIGITLKNEIGDVSRSFDLMTEKLMSTTTSREKLINEIEKHQQTVEKLQEQTQLNKILIDTLPCVALLVRPQTREIVLSNEAGRKAGALPGQTCYSSWGKKDDPCPWCLAPEIWATDKPKHLEVKTQNIIWDAHWHPINKDLYLHYAFDITERRKLEDRFRQSQKMESIGTLAGGIAHEFNNMLGIIIGNTELVLDDIPESNPAVDCIQEIRTASFRAKNVVSKLLSVAQKSPSTREPVQIGPIIKEALGLMRKTIPATIDIRQNIRCASEMILGDATEISQILINLLTNSVHAIHEQTGDLEVDLEAIQLDRKSVIHYGDLTPGAYARLTVRDSGHGIRPELIERVFDPYFTTKDIDEGLGMGLAIVHGIVQKYDGIIKIKSEVGNGTTVEVLFPLIEEQKVVGTEENDIPATGTERILVVDDEPSLVKMVTTILERSGYEVVGKTSSSEALEAFKENPEMFDLVITDMAMPDIAGDRLSQEISRVRPGIPIILCTGNSDRMDANRAMALGIRKYVMKPLAKSDLTKTVREVLDEKRI